MKITDSRTLGQAIRFRRKELGYTQACLSEVTGLSITFISDVERGKPTAETRKNDSPDQHSGAGSSGGKEMMAE